MRAYKHTPEAICDRHVRALCAMADRRNVLGIVSDMMRAYNEARNLIRKAEHEHDVAEMHYQAIWEPDASDDRKMELADLRFADVQECYACYLRNYDKAEEILRDAGMTYTQSYTLLCAMLDW